jgi:hypothetical protein
LMSKFDARPSNIHDEMRVNETKQKRKYQKVSKTKERQKSSRIETKCNFTCLSNIWYDV